jgi:hypothetical protein
LFLLAITLLLGTYLLRRKLDLLFGLVLAVVPLQGQLRHARYRIPLCNYWLTAQDLNLRLEVCGQRHIIAGLEIMKRLRGFAAQK